MNQKGGKSGVKYDVQRTKPFRALLDEETPSHKQLEEDVKWLEGRLEIAPDKMGCKVTGLSGLNLPVFKTRLKDSCCQLAASEGWRCYYAVSNVTNRVYMLFLHHKKDIENPTNKFLQQKIQKAFEAGV